MESIYDSLTLASLPIDLPVRASTFPNFGDLQRLQSERLAQLTLPQL